MNKIYIFIITLLNYSVMGYNQSSLAKGLRIPPKIFTVFNEYKIYSYGGRPIWNDILIIA